MTFADVKAFVGAHRRKIFSALSLSLLFHLLLIGWGLVSFAGRSVEAQAQDFVPVDVISDDQLSQLTKGMKTGDKNEKKQLGEKIADAKPVDEAVGKIAKQDIKTDAAPDAKPAEKPPEKPIEKKPDPPKPVVEKPKDEPKKDETANKKDEKIDPIGEQLKKDQAKQPPKQEVAKQQPQPPKPKERTFDQNQIAALLDKRAPSREAVAGSELNPNSALGVSAGQAQTLTLGWVGALQDRIGQCWAIPAGIRDGDTIKIRVYFELDKAGRVIGRPQLLEAPMNSFGPAVAESAVRAVEQCQPYTFLPQAEYKGGWDKLDLTLSTDGMYRRR
jgi:colicin import membrane protein